MRPLLTSPGDPAEALPAAVAVLPADVAASAGAVVSEAGASLGGVDVGDRLAAARAALARAETAVGVAETATGPAGPPLPAALAPLLPGGTLAPGSVTRIAGSTSLLLALAASAARGGWCALAAVPHLGWRAAGAAGLALDRVAVVPDPGPDAPAVLAALIDGFDVLVVGPCPALRDRDRRSLAGRVRAREAVLLSAADWPGARATLHVSHAGAGGLGQGWGHLREQTLVVRAIGGGVGAGRQVRVRLGPEGLAPERIGSERIGPDGLGAVQETPDAVSRGVAWPARLPGEQPLLRAV